MRLTALAAVFSLIVTSSVDAKPPTFDGVATHKDVDAYVSCVLQGYAKQWPGTRSSTFPEGRRIVIAPHEGTDGVAQMTVANRNDGASLVMLRGAGLSLTTKRDLANVMRQCR